MSDEEHWQVKVSLHGRIAGCRARKGDRKHDLMYIYKGNKFVWQSRSSTLGSPQKQIPPDRVEIEKACLTAIAVARLTK